MDSSLTERSSISDPDCTWIFSRSPRLERADKNALTIHRKRFGVETLAC
jgi:lipocalin